MSSSISTKVGRSNIRQPLCLLTLVTMLVTFVGCEADSFLDPSVTGRWEPTPTVLPILSRLDVIEEPEVPVSGLSQVQTEDLIPTVSEYTIGAGDFLVVSIFELIQPGIESVQSRRVDELGNIRLQIVGQIQASGLTAKQLEQRIIDILDPDILRNPTVSVTVQERRQRTFNVIGGVGSVGSYALLQPNFRLLDALALARGVSEEADKLYVIRQVALADIYETGPRMKDVKPGDHEPPMQKTGDSTTNTPSTNQDNKNPGSLIDSLIDPKGDDQKKEDTKEDTTPKTEGDSTPKVNPALTDALESPAKNDGSERWVNVNGKWVKVTGKIPESSTGDSTLPETSTMNPEDIVTQRVIEIDVQDLLKGEAKYNIVIRPGDVIRVPIDTRGNVYIGGAINRPGTYALPGKNKLTLKQLIYSAGNLSGIAIPERVDIIRRVGENEEATMRLNYRAIAEGVQPDIFLKPDDTINIGTNFWAQPLAVIRNSFRFSYGFGFLLDRNFGYDVYGPQDRDTR